MGLPSTGSNPRYVENLRVGGGYGSLPDGGVDMDGAGNAALSGDLTVDGAASFLSSITSGNLTVKSDGGIPYLSISDDSNNQDVRIQLTHGGVGTWYIGSDYDDARTLKFDWESSDFASPALELTTGGDMTVHGDMGLGANGVNTMWSTWFGPGNGLVAGNTSPPSAQTLQVYEANITECESWVCLTAANSRMSGALELPEDYDGRALVADVYWTQSSTDTGNVRFQLTNTVFVDGDDLTGTGPAHAAPSVNHSPPGVVGELIVTSITFTPANAADAAGQILTVLLARSGNHVDDTNTRSAFVLGLKFHY